MTDSVPGTPSAGEHQTSPPSYPPAGPVPREAIGSRSSDPPPMPPPPELAGSSVHRGSVAAAIQVAGLVTAGFGLLGLPLQSAGLRASLTYWSLHEYATNRRPPMTSVAAAWFDWGAVSALGVVALLVIIGVALPRQTIVGGLTGAAALLTLGWHVFATSGTGNIMGYARTFRRVGSTWDDPGSGVWVGIAGLGVVVVGALIAVLARRR